jgi:hypothetical protein
MTSRRCWEGVRTPPGHKKRPRRTQTYFRHSSAMNGRPVPRTGLWIPFMESRFLLHGIQKRQGDSSFRWNDGRGGGAPARRVAGTKKGPEGPKNKMGADLATSPHLSRVRTAAPVRAWRHSRAGRGNVGASSSVTPAGFRPRSCDLGRFPFAGPSPEGSGSAGRPKKVGSACASRFFLDRPPSASVASVPKDSACFRGGPRLRASLPCGRSALPREGPQCPASVIRTSGISGFLPVDNGDIVDN